MVGGNYPNSLVQKFQEYKKENETMFIWIERIIARVNDSENLENELKKSDVLTKKSKDSEKDVFNILDTSDKPTFLRLCNELKQVISDENEQINKMMGKIVHDEIGLANELRNRIVSYNQQKYDLIVKLGTIHSSFVKDIKDMVGLVEIMINDSANKFVAFYNNLNKLISQEKDINKGALFSELASAIRYLSQYLPQTDSIYRDNQNSLLKNIENSSESGSKNARKFAENFFSSLGSDTYKQLNEILEKHEMELGTQEGKSYSSIKEDDDKEKIDKFMKNTLNSLFKGIKDKDKLIKKIFEDDDDERGNRSSDTDKIWKDALEVKEKDIKENFSEGINTIRDNLVGIQHIIGIEDNWNEGKLNVDLTEFISIIVKILKSFGKNINNYKKKVKNTNWNSEFVKELTKEIKDCIEKWEKDLSNKSNIESAIRKTYSLLEELK